MITQYLLPGAEQAVAELAGDVAVMGGGTTVMPAVHVGALDASRVVGLARGDSRGSSAPTAAPPSGRRRPSPPSPRSTTSPRCRPRPARSAVRRFATWPRWAATS